MIYALIWQFVNEGGVPDGTPDNYLHEAAQAGDPPSGTVYDLENDGTHLESLGVHEHWNNYTDKQYSRNLGTGDGIELIQVINQTVSNVSIGIYDLMGREIKSFEFQGLSTEENRFCFIAIQIMNKRTRNGIIFISACLISGSIFFII